MQLLQQAEEYYDSIGGLLSSICKLKLLKYGSNEMKHAQIMHEVHWISVLIDCFGQDDIEV